VWKNQHLKYNETYNSYFVVFKVNKFCCFLSILKKRRFWLRRSEFEQRVIAKFFDKWFITLFLHVWPLLKLFRLTTSIIVNCKHSCRFLNLLKIYTIFECSWCLLSRYNLCLSSIEQHILYISDRYFTLSIPSRNIYIVLNVYYIE
jgi:hypothetical protein